MAKSHFLKPKIQIRGGREMGIFGKKKKFGLDEALKAESLATIPADHATTGMAILEAVGIPVTAGTEAEEKIAELKDSVKTLEEGIKATRAELDVAPGIATKAIEALKAELKKLADAVRDAVSVKVRGIESGRDENVSHLGSKIEIVKEKAKTKIRKARGRGDDRVKTIEKKIDAKIAEIEAKNEKELSAFKDHIENLEAEAANARTEIGTLEPIMAKWTLPKK